MQKIGEDGVVKPYIFNYKYLQRHSIINMLIFKEKWKRDKLKFKD